MNFRSCKTFVAGMKKTFVYLLRDLFDEWVETWNKLCSQDSVETKLKKNIEWMTL